MVELRNALQRELGDAMQLSNATLFDCSCVEDLANEIHRGLPAAWARNKTLQSSLAYSSVARSTPPSHVKHNRTASVSASPSCIPAFCMQGVPVVASFQQEQMYFLHTIHPHGSALNESVCISMQGSVRVDLLKKAVRVVMDRHDALRTCLFEPNALHSGGYHVLQLTTAPGELQVPFRHHCLESGAEAAEVLSREARVPFNISEAPLFRVHLCQVPAPDDSYLLLVFHHAVIDGMSFGR
eukprot:112563-Rhodomonas_salina.1